MRMGIVFGLMAVVGGFAMLPWLATLAGVLAIATDGLGFMSGALKGCAPTVVSWVLGAVIGGGILGAMGLPPTAAVMGGIALAALVGDAVGYVFVALAGR
jgi:hypothetical protein